DYLKTLGVTLIKGRLVDETERAGKPPVVVISEELAREAWPGEDPLGKRIKRVRPNQDFLWMTVVGVVKDVKEDLFNYRINRPVWYVPYAQLENNFPLNLVVRTSGDPASATAAVRETVHAIDPDQPISNVMTMNENLGGVLVTERFGAILMSLLANLLFGVSATDPTTIVSILLLFTGVALLACLLPARRALAVDPIQALRTE